ncbi:MAG TPA: CorA family divalent cation transporter [Actinoplanes sp.]
MVNGWPASRDAAGIAQAAHPGHASVTRVWRRIRVTGDVVEGQGLMSLHRPALGGEAGLIWQHLDRADETGVRSFLSISGFAYGEELLDAALIGPRRARTVQHGDATSFAFLAARWDPDGDRGAGRDQVTTEPMAIVIADDYLLTVGRADAIDFGAVLRRVRGLTAERRDRPPTVPSLRVILLLGLLESAVEDFANCVDELVATLNRIEETVFAHPADSLLGSRAIYQYKRELMTLKRAVIPLRQPLATMLGQQSAAVDDDVRRHVNLVENNLTQIVERTMYCDDAINSMLQANLAQIDVAQNSDMRRIAAVGAILAVWGIIAGVYQMTEDFGNLHRAHGIELFWWTVAGAAALSVLLCVLFRRIRWL